MWRSRRTGKWRNEGHKYVRDGMVEEQKDGEMEK